MVSHSRSTGRHGFALMEVVVAGMVLAIGLAAVLSLSTRSLVMQQRGERAIAAAALLDDLLGMVLTEGPEDFSKLHDLAGNCDAPWADFEYEVRIEAGGLGDPHDVEAVVRDPTGREYRVFTKIAVRGGEDPNPDRAPEEPIDRRARDEEAANKGAEE